MATTALDNLVTPLYHKWEQSKNNITNWSIMQTTATTGKLTGNTKKLELMSYV